MATSTAPIEQSQRAGRLIGELQTDHPRFRLIAYFTGKDLYNRSGFHEKAGRMDEAERLFREALPGSSPPLKAYGNLLAFEWRRCRLGCASHCSVL